MLNARIAVLGLEDVGRELVKAAAHYYPTVAFADNDTQQQTLMPWLQQRADALTKTAADWLAEPMNMPPVELTQTVSALRAANVYLVCTPSWPYAQQQQALSAMADINALLAQVLKRGDLVVYCMPLYPDVLAQLCIPLLQTSGLYHQAEFYTAYVPLSYHDGIISLPKVAYTSSRIVAESLAGLLQRLLAQPIADDMWCDEPRLVEQEIFVT